MIDQLIIGDKASFDDFGASIASRKIGMPPKKSIKETVPFSNVTYDFSAINGEVYWNERELEYVFEITADDPEELEALKSRFSAWVMNVQEQDIHDPFIPDYHFKGTYADMSPDDDESVEKTTLTVKFTAYPYKVANLPKVYSVTVAAHGEKTFFVVNESDHRIPFSFVSGGALKVEIGSTTWDVPEGESADENARLPIGPSTVTVRNEQDADCTFSIRFREEVF